MEYNVLLFNKTLKDFLHAIEIRVKFYVKITIRYIINRQSDRKSGHEIKNNI